MIIRQGNFMNTFIPTKYQSPLIVDSDAMKTSQITFQRFEPIGRGISNRSNGGRHSRHPIYAGQFLQVREGSVAHEMISIHETDLLSLHPERRDLP
jgi:hypothetical protein